MLLSGRKAKLHVSCHVRLLEGRDILWARRSNNRCPGSIDVAIVESVGYRCDQRLDLWRLIFELFGESSLSHDPSIAQNAPAFKGVADAMDR